MGDTSRSPTIATKLQRIAEQAVQYPAMVFTTLLYLIDVDFLREAYQRTRKDSAPGIDGVTAEEYAEHLEENLRDLHERIQSGRYKAPPVKRSWLDKEDGSQRPIGMPTFEDKVVQRAVAWLLGAIYEQDFYKCSYGFREGCNQHQALHALREQCLALDIRWIVDADVSGFFDAIDHRRLQEHLRRRVNDGGIVRLIGKWLDAGVVEGEILTYPEHGTPQGGVVSPLLANIYLHYVFDLWAEQWRGRHARGDVIIVRYCDDFLVGFQYQDEAERFWVELRERFHRFNLEWHPEKTRLIEFGRFAVERRKRRGEGKPETFDFLGFTHMCGKTRKGKFTVRRKTVASRLRRKLHEVKQTLRRRMCLPIPSQGTWLRAVLLGHYRYFAVPRNSSLLRVFREGILRSWCRTLRRRSQRHRITWTRMYALAQQWLPQPRILHPYPAQRLCVTT